MRRHRLALDDEFDVGVVTAAEERSGAVDEVGGEKCGVAVGW